MFDASSANIYSKEVCFESGAGQFPGGGHIVQPSLHSDEESSYLGNVRRSLKLFVWRVPQWLQKGLDLVVGC